MDLPPDFVAIVVGDSAETRPLGSSPAANSAGYVRPPDDQRPNSHKIPARVASERLSLNGAAKRYAARRRLAPLPVRYSATLPRDLRSLGCSGYRGGVAIPRYQYREMPFYLAPEVKNGKIVDSHAVLSHKYIGSKMDLAKAMATAREFAKLEGLYGDSADEGCQQAVIWFWQTEETDYLKLRNFIQNYKRRVEYARTHSPFVLFSEIPGIEEMFAADDPALAEVDVRDMRDYIVRSIEEQQFNIAPGLSDLAIAYVTRGRKGVASELNRRRQSLDFTFDGRVRPEPDVDHNIDNAIVRVRALLRQIVPEVRRLLA